VFKSGLGGKLTLKLDDAELGVLSQLFEQMAELLEHPESEAGADPLAKMLNMSGSTQISEDPALARLFPDGYSDDEHASADFRRFTEQDLRAQKLAALTTVRDSLIDWSGKSSITAQQAQDWLKALNDLRLVLGTRLEITDEVETDFEADEPGIHLYNYLTYLQGTLIDALT
jgi:alkanesulfonate monooxygenase SsuD/methylene tetrahydromethanopterin reductase-like flavin-dependent oxidoreductase (luciferase family)